MWKFLDGCLFFWMPGVARRFFIGGEFLEFCRPGTVEEAKKAVWDKLGNPEAAEEWMSGIIWADSVHLSWERQHQWNDFKPVFHGLLGSSDGDVVLSGRISAKRSTRLFFLVLLIILLGVAAVFAHTVVVPLACLAMAGLQFVMIAVCRSAASDDERHIIHALEDIFGAAVTATRTRES